MGRRTKSKQTEGFSSTLGARQQWRTFTCQPSSQVSAPTAVDWLYATGRPKANQYQISDTGIKLARSASSAQFCQQKGQGPEKNVGWHIQHQVFFHRGTADTQEPVVLQ